MGSAYPGILHAVEWLVRLHDNLLAGSTGRIVNGLGGLLLTVLAVSGLVVWWSGKNRWRSAIWTGQPAMSSVFARRLHVAVGFWTSSLILVWAVTAIYFAFPSLFDGLFDLLDRNPDDDARPGEQLLDGVIRLHFGRLGGMVGRTTWIILGLVPSMLVVTGVIMWLSRRKRLRPGRVAP